MIHNHWLIIAHHDSQPLARHNTPWFTSTGSAYHTMIHNQWLSITHSVLCWSIDCESRWVMLRQWLWIIYVMLSQWLWIMVCYSVPFDVNHGEYTLWFTTTGSVQNNMIHNYKFRITLVDIMVNYAEPMVVNYGVLCCANGCESCCVILNQWWCIKVCYAEPLVVNQTQHDALPLAQHSKPWFTTTGSPWHIMIHNNWLSITQHASQALPEQNTPLYTTSSSS
jgi:hypothetical protein